MYLVGFYYKNKTRASKYRQRRTMNPNKFRFKPPLFRFFVGLRQPTLPSII